MKKALLLLILFHNYVNGQFQYDFCFDQLNNCYNSNQYGIATPILTIDFNANPNNIWQIGTPQKPNLNSAWSAPKVIITDTINTYPVNNTSSFTIESTAIAPSSSIGWSNFGLSFRYFVDSDTLTDFGMIEFSPDNGTTWIDLINDPTYSGYLNWGSPPVLSGTSGGWKEDGIYMGDLGDFLDIQPGTVFKWRFTFISDGIQNNRDGLMYDNIFIEITPPIGLEEFEINPNRTLIKVIDMLGNETAIKTNTLLIYLYDDGSTEKVIKVE